jgi:hypothetical protein
MGVNPKSYHFAVYFEVMPNNKLEISVETPAGKILTKEKNEDVLPIAKYPIKNVNQLDVLQVSHDYSQSPCCVIWDGHKYCWC